MMKERKQAPDKDLVCVPPRDVTQSSHWTPTQKTRTASRVSSGAQAKG